MGCGGILETGIGMLSIAGVAVARIIVFALALTHVIGIADLMLDDECGDLCSGDGCDEDCPPGTACRCHCPSATPLVGGAVIEREVVVNATPAAPFERVQRTHASPDPCEILHVPRRAA